MTNQFADTASISMTVNGQHYKLLVETRKSLADMLRDDLGVRGIRVGCEHGVCGSCTVLMDRIPIRACLTLAVQADGSDIETVESLATGEVLHPIQQAFREEHGLQCGFCTPGILLSVQAMLEDNPQPDDDEILDVLGGHLCRCTGYQQILRSVKRAIELTRSAT